MSAPKSSAKHPDVLIIAPAHVAVPSSREWITMDWETVSRELGDSRRRLLGYERIIVLPPWIEVSIPYIGDEVLLDTPVMRAVLDDVALHLREAVHLDVSVCILLPGPKFECPRLLHPEFEIREPDRHDSNLPDSMDGWGRSFQWARRMVRATLGVDVDGPHEFAGSETLFADQTPDALEAFLAAHPPWLSLRPERFEWPADDLTVEYRQALSPHETVLIEVKEQDGWPKGFVPLAHLRTDRLPPVCGAILNDQGVSLVATLRKNALTKDEIRLLLSALDGLLRPSAVAVSKPAPIEDQGPFRTYRGMKVGDLKVMSDDEGTYLQFNGGKGKRKTSQRGRGEEFLRILDVALEAGEAPDLKVNADRLLHAKDLPAHVDINIQWRSIVEQVYEVRKLFKDLFPGVRNMLPMREREHDLRWGELSKVGIKNILRD